MANDQMRQFLLNAIPQQSPLVGLYGDISPINAQGGGGNFSVVFKATHLPTGRDTALKFLADDDPYRTACFDREGMLLSQHLKNEELFIQLIASPTTIPIQATTPFGPISFSFRFLPFEWIAKGDISRLAQATTGYSDLLSRLAVFNGMCRCVSRLHRKQCVHRDLKASNFMIDQDDRVRLGDFGTARLLVHGVPPLMSPYQFTVGDLRYTAPEMMAGLHTDPALFTAADFYSLGAILFEMLTGQLLSVHTLGQLMQLHAFTIQAHQVPESQRAFVYQGWVRGKGSGVPDLRTINPQIPRCVAGYLKELIEMLSHLDYRMRTMDLVRAHRIIRICEILLRHEARARRIHWPHPIERQRDRYV